MPAIVWPRDDLRVSYMTVPSVTAGTTTIVNSTTVDNQQNPVITHLKDGGYVIVWNAWSSTTNMLELTAQRYDSTGAKVGGEFHTVGNTSNQTALGVAGIDDGGYVIVWGKVVGNTGVYQQRFDASGAAVGGETHINTWQNNYVENPSITALSDGGWFVSWQSQGEDGNSYGAYGQRYNSAGVAIGGEVHLTDRTGGNQDSPRAALLSDGGFIVVYEDYNGGPAAYDVYAQRYDANSQKVGTDVMISVPADYRQQYAPDVTAMSDGGYLVVWQANGQDGDGYGIYTRRYDANGNAVTGEVQVNTTTAHDQERAAVTLLSDGGYVIVWQSTFEDYNDRSQGPMGAVYTDVYAQVFDKDGNKVAGEIHVNTLSNMDYNDAAPKVTALSGDRFVVTWSGHASLDSNDYDIYQTIYTVTPGYVTLTGDSGNNTLDGTGTDAHMAGLGGDDTYIVDNTDDQVTEGLNAGTDTVQSSITWTLGDNVENLVLTGSATIDGTGNSLANVLTGNDGDNRLYGLDGGDRLDGGAGSNTLYGGLGDDTYVVHSHSDTVVENSGEGTDTVESSVEYGLGDDVENLVLTGTGDFDGGGNALDNKITGNDGNNVLYGGDGNDLIDGAGGSNIMQGGAGDDTYVVRTAADYVMEWDGQGTDTVRAAMTYSLGDAIENLVLTGTDNVDGTGNELNNVLAGNDGDNRLDGQAGADTMSGGLGNDTYVVDGAGDRITEAADGGTDTVESAVNYELGDNVENLILTSSNLAIGYGNGLDNVLTGGSGTNALDGRGGDDTMIGGDGNDTYFVDSAADVVVENPGEGQDWVYAAVSYRVSANVEYLTLAGSGNINATAGATAITMWGNEGNNVLTGSAVADTLYGLSGNDLLDGGPGVDTMYGGAGDDTYIVGNGRDIVCEQTIAGTDDGGTDTVKATFSYTLGDGVENLVLSKSGDINGTGNALDNSLTGNAGNNRLDGGEGADYLTGNAGDDTYVVDNAGDVVVEKSNGGNDTVWTSVSYRMPGYVENLVLTGTEDIAATGNTMDNVITGNAGGNAINGGVGADTMYGGSGNDTYYVDNIGDVVSEQTVAGLDDGGTDTVRSTISYTLGDLVEKLVLTGADSIDGTGNALGNSVTGNSGDNRLYGLDGNDIINGGVGVDTMYGGAGDDTYTVDNIGDVVSEQTVAGIDDGGTDTVRSTISYVLGDLVENLILSGTEAIDGTGNALGNSVTGNSGDNTLVGQGGNDRLTGGAGADTFVFGPGSGIDTITDFSTDNDLVDVTAYHLSALVLTQSGTSAVVDLGDGNQIILLNSAADPALASHILW